MSQFLDALVLCRRTVALVLTLAAVFAVNAGAAWADGGISGNVTDELGDPIPGACVFAGSNTVSDSGTDVTDANGDYEIEQPHRFPRLSAHISS